MTNPLREIGRLGQSVWYDNLTRELLKSGELRRMVEQDGVRGVTSNPTIFEKAISSEKSYDNDLHGLVDQGLGVGEIYEELVVADIREAADILAGIYEETEGKDGFVSLEVSPQLAYDAAGTEAQARHLFKRVDRRNVMIKVPATTQGLSAVKRLIASGININVTLIFSLEQYLLAARAYVEGLEECVAAGGDPRGVASVASFFVSRVDTLVDERLDEITDPSLRTTIASLKGKAAIANARLAYALFKDAFHGERFEKLRSLEARPQRVLWASTSTKNPAYPDTYYVDALIGPETVNTMPHATLLAFLDHGKPAMRLEENLDEAQALFVKLEELGVSVAEVMEQLLENGLKSFGDSYELLLEGIAQKRTRLLRGWGHRSASLGELQKKVDQTLARLDTEKIAEGLWSHDTSLWASTPEVRCAVGQRLGWLHIIEIMMGEQERLKEFSREITAAGFKDVVLLGMGGSCLTSEVFSRCYASAQGFPRLTVIDSTIPASILSAERAIDPEQTLFIVSSKSGTTVETAALHRYFLGKMEQIAGPDAGKRFIAITDPGTVLGKLASEQGFRRIFLNPPDVGGRFSGLSYFGLVPASLMGIDLSRLLMRADQAVEAAGPDVPSLESPGTWLGVIISEAALAGRDKLTLVISPKLASFGDWLEQLIAESTGKEGTGILPVQGEALGPPEVYGNDRLFVYLRMDGDDTHDGQIFSLEQAGQPVITQRLHSAYDIGREMFRWEAATAIAGNILKINPFDEPNVKEAKDFTVALLEAYKKDGRLPEGESMGVRDPALPGLLQEMGQGLQQGDYLALNAFLPATPTALELLQAQRLAWRNRFRVATTLGFGPRYLHSTGQIHKGGKANGAYVILTMTDAEDIPIPGEAYSFGVLKTAQALGDVRALKKRGRPVIHVHLEDESDLTSLLDMVNGL